MVSFKLRLILLLRIEYATGGNVLVGVHLAYAETAGVGRTGADLSGNSVE